MKYEVRTTPRFDSWFEGITDPVARRALVARIARIESGLFGDVAPVGGGVSELRIDTGPGYRVYFARIGRTIVLLLCGGDKSSQSRDISRAQDMAAEL
ncbi:MAG: type II toxin-antitoxin system RelE/ParE family toxin [Sphingomonadaceae bacterium]